MVCGCGVCVSVCEVCVLVYVFLCVRRMCCVSMYVVYGVCLCVVCAVCLVRCVYCVSVCGVCLYVRCVCCVSVCDVSVVCLYVMCVCFPQEGGRKESYIH